MNYLHYSKICAILQVSINFFPVGHTHEDIDQFFSRIASQLTKIYPWSADYDSKLLSCSELLLSWKLQYLWLKYVRYVQCLLYVTGFQITRCSSTTYALPEMVYNTVLSIILYLHFLLNWQVLFLQQIFLSLLKPKEQVNGCGFDV